MFHHIFHIYVLWLELVLARSHLCFQFVSYYFYFRAIYINKKVHYSNDK